MIRTMLDTDTPQTLGRRANILATYADLISISDLAELETTWPAVVLIDRGQGDRLGRASIIDVETGTHAPGDAPAWHDRQAKAGVKHLTVYANRTTMPEVEKAMGKRGFYRWYATLDGTAHIDGYTPGQQPAAVQILGESALGFHADLSLVFEDGWNPAAADNAWVATAAIAAANLAGQLDSLSKEAAAEAKNADALAVKLKARQ